MKLRTVVFLLSVIAAAGCKKGDKAGSGTGPEAPAAWADKDHEQRIAYMKSTVLPKMKEVFAEWTEEDLGEVNCKTCHGAGADDGSFEMPSPDLPVLPASEEGWAALAEDHPTALKFMAERVKPEMAALLGLEEMDPETAPDGFGCYGCHTVEGE